MYYSDVRKTKAPKRTADRLLKLKQAFREQGVPEKSNDTMLLATWNIREFDSNAYGKRSLECLYYIAEICAHFDLIAVQEVREDLEALNEVRRILGDGWTYIVSDVSEGKAGNRERMAFLYDSGKVSFNSMAGEVVIPSKSVKKNGKTVRYDPAEQLYRTPYLVGFRCGWAVIMLCTVHIAYGKDKAEDPTRVREIKMVAEFLAKRARERKRDYSNLVLLGDFNIYSSEDITYKAITDAGFEIPPELQELPETNVGSEKRHYDQIAFMPQKWRVETTGKANMFDYYQVVYRDNDEDRELYISEMGDAYTTTSEGKPRDESGKRTYYRTYWRTHQMSDHLPMWIELRTNFANEYLVDIRDKQAN